MTLSILNKLKRGFTMVEMLAVIAVMAIIVALVVPNGIHARTVGEEATVRAQAAALEMGLSTYLMQYGAQAKVNYINAKTAAGADPYLQMAATVGLLKQEGALPQSVSPNSMGKTFEGYNLVLPNQLGGGLRVTRTVDGNALQIYP
jgi:prepilin-type N-terminal cleavage/methylation domain-containing protein